ncbi:uncharacterized protein BHQ10_000447 [Talaromyces amestolkiae]|uniref:Uncharacterized protein n=1 Tax=Talaromyces amestolkiae TaxID=1196081 RepID=A0A364KLL2_TALAM|nr:uncharacterized protein BHQ10_000447 [Talaromyces amestolkiae]RAO64435.1 hypothetical protein BHQ10_000447 [Talaromyces amestolkiae]
MDDIHTTAKWANRMLRPLTSLYHRLGKHSESINAQEEEINKIVAAATNTEYTKRDASGDAEYDSEYGDRDPSWIPQNPELKRVKHKYVARGERLRLQPRARVLSVLQSPEATKTLPGAIEIATPLITGKSTDVFGTNNKGLGPGHRYNFPSGFNPWRPDTPGRDPIRLLQRYWQVSNNKSYVFKEIELLLLRNIMPPEWLVTITLKDCVIAACTSQSKWDNEYAAAISLIKTILITAGDAHRGRKDVKKTPIKKRTQTKKQTQDTSYSQADSLDVNQGRCPVHLQDATSNLVSSLNAALCCMYGVRMGQPDGPDYISGERIVKTYTDLALTIQRSLPLSGFGVEDNEASRASLLRKGYTLLAHFVLRSQQDLLLLDDTDVKILDVVLSQNCEPFFGLLEQNVDIIKNLSVMVCQIIRLSERGDELAQCQQARRLCKHLLKYERSGLEKLTLFLGKIAIEVALDFAQYSQDAEDHTFAADIQEAVATIRRRIKSHSNCAPTPGKSSMQSFRWEEGIGEWIAKTPLDRTKATMPRVLSQPIVEIASTGPSSSASATSPSLSIDSESSNTSIALSSSTNLKRRRTSIVSLQPNVKRPRRIYKKKVFKKIRQSTRIATRLSDISVVAQGKDYKDSSSHSDYESDYEQDAEDAEAASESEEWLPPTETGDTPDAAQGTRTVRELQGSVAEAQTQRMRAGFDVIIHNAAAAPVAPIKRGRGRPRKQVARPASCSASQTNGPQAHAHVSRRSVIPCSEDEDSDDELSFL